jgi:hypothetical protein
MQFSVQTTEDSPHICLNRGEVERLAVLFARKVRRSRPETKPFPQSARRRSRACRKAVYWMDPSRYD